MTRRTMLALALCAAGQGMAGAAAAAPLSAFDILGQFNAVIFGNFASTADVEGRTVIGGNMTGGATFNLAPGASAASAHAGLTVYGNQTGTGSYNVNNGGGVTILGANAGSFSLNGGGSAWVGGASGGTLNVAGGPGSVAIGGGNSGQISLSAGGSVFVGGASTGQVHVNGGSGAVAVIGAATNAITLNQGGSVHVGGTSPGASINVNGASGAVSVGASNAGQVTLNGGGSLRIAGDTGNVNMNGGSLLYTGNITGAVNLNGGATGARVAEAGIVPPSPPVPPDAASAGFAATFRDPLMALSSQVGALEANSSVTRSGNAVTFAANPDQAGLAVFDIGSSVFAPNSTVTLALNGATSVVINVSVDACVDAVCALALPSSLNFVDPTGYAERVLWNFVNATSIAFPNEFGGSVLAPLASVSNQAPINGTLVAANYDGNGELHARPWLGSPTPAADVPVPEPSGLLALGAGLAGLGWFRRCRAGRRCRAA